MNIRRLLLSFLLYCLISSYAASNATLEGSIRYNDTTVSQDSVVNNLQPEIDLMIPPAPSRFRLKIDTLSHNPEQQSLVSDNAKLAFNQPRNNIMWTRVNVANRPSQFQARVNHGEAPVGVIGCMFDPIAGTFLAVYPGSDLLRFGIHPGDSYLAISGQPIVHSISWFQNMTRGQPGTYVSMTVLHNGRPTDISVMRKDSRLFVQYYNGDNYFRWCAAQTRYW